MEATDATRLANEAVLGALPCDDAGDVQGCERGFIAPLPDAVVDGGDRSVWDARAFDFIDGDPPDTVKPSLWRRIEGDAGAFRAMLDMLDDFEVWFDIVTP